MNSWALGCQPTGQPRWVQFTANAMKLLSAVRRRYRAVRADRNARPAGDHAEGHQAQPEGQGGPARSIRGIQTAYARSRHQPPQVDERENDDPDRVDEVPVDRHGVEGRVAPAIAEVPGCG